MIKADLEFFRQWFSGFCKSFYTADIGDQKHILLKEQHTFKVCENMIAIVKGLSLNDGHLMPAETVALFHDVGRFPQYARYKTFRDGISVNHGLLGAETLIEHKVLQNLPPEEQELVIESVKFHNAFSVPKKEREDINLFIKLIRDADKLDIWRVFLDHFEGPPETMADAITLGLPDTPEYSREVLSHIFKKETAPHLQVRTVNDFKLLQLSWVFDLNFKPTFELLSERGYIDRLASHLPQTEEICQATVFVKEFLRQRLKE